MASDGTIKIDTKLDSTKAKSALSEFSSLGKTALNGVKIAVGAVSTAMTAMAAYSIKAGSDFEAGMSKVSAISGATGAELDALSDKAKEMGAKTKFSATEAASAFEYMAMAGWKTEDMLNGIEGVMNLAAASGEDLASTSDIVTDALTAFGLTAQDSTHFADILAQASSNANTNVGMMGETFKYVAPVAGALGYSAEDTATAIGLMANAGIKGSQAGTALRSIMSRLAKPTDEVQSAMDALGISLTDEQGKMKGLNEIMDDLRAGFSGLSEAEAAQTAAVLGGQEAMSGLLAIVNASDADFNKLQSAIYSCGGAAEKMAATMNDNLQGSITIAGSALEGFGIKVYEKMEAPLKEAVDTGTDCINRLASAFDSGGLNGVVEEAGEIFNELADDIAGSSRAAEGIVTPLKNIANAGAGLGKTVLPVMAGGLKLAAENLDVLLPLVTGAVAGLKAFTIIGKTAAATVKANAAAMAVLNKLEKANALQLTALNGGLTVRQTLLALYNGQITLTTALTGLWAKAQTALNTAFVTNPIGAVVAGVAAFTAGMAALVTILDKAVGEDYRLSDSQKKALKSLEDTTKALNEQKAAREESILSIDREYEGYESLLSELQSITDAGGRVKEGYEERAKVITGQLSSALGTEITMMDGVIEKYDETVNSIKELIVQKKAEALASSMQDDMAQAYKKSEQAIEDYKNAQAALEEQQKKVTEAEEAYRKGGPAQYKMWQQAKAEQEELAQALQETKTTMQELSVEVNNYDALMDAMESGNTAKMEEAMNALVTAYQSYTTEALNASGEIRQEMYDQAAGFVENLKLVQDGTVQVADSVYQDMSRAALNSILEFNKVPGGVGGAIKEIVPEASAAMADALAQADLSGQLDDEARKEIEVFIGGLSGLDEETKNVWAQAWYGALEGLEGFEQLADPAEEGADTFLESLKSALEVHSPSEAARRIFAQVWPGASKGLSDGADSLNTKGSGVIASFLNGLSAVGEGAKGVGTKIMSFFGIGVSSQQGNSKSAGRLNADAANAGAGSVNPAGTGGKFGSQYASGVGGKISEAMGKGKSLASNADSGARSRNGYDAGSSFGSGFIRGIGSWISSAASKAAEMASSALNAAKRALDSHSPSKKGRKLGKTLPQGVELGIKDDTKLVEKASAEMAETALGAFDMGSLAEKIKCMDIPDVMGRVYAAVEGRQWAVADKITHEHAVRAQAENMAGVEETRQKMKNEDLRMLGEIFAEKAAPLMVKALAESGLKMEMYGEKVGGLISPVIDNGLSVASIKAGRYMNNGK